MSQILVTGEAKIRDIQGPVVSNSGVITALDGDASQYVRGDGTLADFPTSTGGGSSVSYYLNSSVSQGTIGGVAYRQLSKTPISGAGTDITISANGYIASYITDANDPALLEVPAGNFNCEFYFSVNSNAHNPYVYAELYKYDGTTFTLLGSNVAIPEYLTNGTTLSAYYFAIPVAVAALTITDRLAIRIYVNVDGRVVTLHTENNHLCQVVTTFSKGLISLNNLTRQNQFFATGTSGTDFGISSSVATHTFNLPVASAANTGKLSSTDWSTFNGKVPYTGATTNVDLGLNNLTANNVFGETSLNVKILPSGSVFSTGYSTLSSLAGNFTMAQEATSGNLKAFTFDFSAWATNTSRTFTLPDITGTLALLEGSQTFSGAKSFSGGATFTSLLNINRQINIFKTPSLVAFTGGYITNYGTSNGIVYVDGDTGNLTTFIYNFGGNYNYTFPAASGTIALTSNLSSYVPYTGATTDVDLGVNSYIGQNLFIKSAVNNIPWVTNYLKLGYIKQSTTLTFTLGVDTGNVHSLIFTSGNSYAYTFPNTNGTIALTSDLGAYVTLATTQTISGAKTFGSSVSINTGGQASLSILSSSGNSALILGYVNSVLKGTIDISATEFKLISAIDNILKFQSSTNFRASLIFSNSADYSYTYPNATGTLALTSNLSAYLPLAGGTLTGALSGTSATFSGAVTLATSSGVLAVNTTGRPAGVGGGDNGKIWSKQATTGNYGIATIASATDSFTYIGHNGTDALLGTSYGTTGAYTDLVLQTADTTRFRLSGSTGAATFSSTITTAALSRIGDVFIGGRSGTYASYTDGVFGDNLHLGATSVGGAVYINTALSRNLIINPVGGNVGIGTSSPSPLTAGALITQINSSNANVELKLTNSSASNGFLIAQYGVNNYISNRENGFMAFDTNATERMRITSIASGGYTKISNYGGYINVNGNYHEIITNRNNENIAYLTNTAASPYGPFIYFLNAAPNNTTNYFLQCADASVVCFTIWSNGTTSGRSDIRLKKNVVDATPKLDKLMQLRLVNYEWKESIDGGKELGLIAQEVEEVFPNLVITEPIKKKREIEQEDGTIIEEEYIDGDSKSVKNSVLPYITIKALQELTTLVQEQQAQIEELKTLILAK